MITIKNLSKTYGENTILHDINLDVLPNSVTAILGPSGSGKTTLLRIIDLLEEPTSGEIYFNGTGYMTLDEAKLEMRRRMVIVLQKPIVFSGSVYDNVSYGLKIRGLERKYSREKVMDSLESVGMSGYENRKANTLSGGEVQRVAIARAMVIEPELLLLDEPTANLDPVSTAIIERLITGLVRDFHTTVILATHDMAQGQRLADQIGVLIGGSVLQVGNSNEIFNLPVSMQVANFVGMENILEGIVISEDSGIVNVSIGSHSIEAVANLESGEHVSACIRPEDITLSLTQASTSARNAFVGTITNIVVTGPLARVSVDCSFPLVVLITSRSAQELALNKGKEVYVSFKATGVHLIQTDEI